MRLRLVIGCAVTAAGVLGCNNKDAASEIAPVERAVADAPVERSDGSSKWC